MQLPLVGRAWTVPWTCDSAQTQWIFRRVVAAADLICQQLGFAPCRTLLAAIHCENWKLTVLAALSTLVTIMYLSRVYRWYLPKQSSTLAAAAAAAAVELRRANPQQYPPASHSWQRIAGRQLAKPLLCAVCFDHLVSANDDSAMMNTCEVCGEVAHEGCARHVPHDCRPVSIEARNMNHLWRPAGITTSTSPDDIESPLQTCHYCHFLCEADAFSREPIWECAWCSTVAHVRCYLRVHPKVNNKENGKTNAAPASSSTGRAESLEQQHSQGCSSEGLITSSTTPTAAASNGYLGLRRIRTSRNDGQTSSAHSNDKADDGQHAPGKDTSAENLAVRSSAGALSKGTRSWDGNSHAPAWEGPCEPSRRLGSYAKAGSMGRLMTALSAMVSDVADSDVPQPSPGAFDGSMQPFQQLQTGESHVARLDRCGIGSHWQLVMPPTAFRELPSVTWSARAKSLLPSRPGRRASSIEGSQAASGSDHTTVKASAVEQVADTAAAVGGAAVAATTKAVQSATSAAASVAAAAAGGVHWDAGNIALETTGIAGVPPTTAELRDGIAKEKQQEKEKEKKIRHRKTQSHVRAGHSWWGLSQDTPWPNYTIGPVPLGLKPILVFINTKSGPQTGKELRRKFLRVLNPLQVVELPRERPDLALALFADVVGLRLLVVGGDGTVGWVLSCLDALQEQRQKQRGTAQEGQADNNAPDDGSDDRPARHPVPPLWLPPPMAVFPIGTGNDLARCLNWGGNMSAHQGASPLQLLALMEQSAVTLLDRWRVSFSLSPPPQKKAQTPKQSAETHCDGALSAPPARPAIERPASQATKGRSAKAMNNYMGIGIDAKVALEFHHIREQYPEWFHSQFGNKLWYTGVGAKDILAQSPLHLSTHIKLECDGQEVVIPPDTEGILLLNIPSYMGGVNIWASGRPAGPPAAVERPQSMCDRRLEVVAVYGSWHLGRMQVGLSQARRLVQCSSARITLLESMPMQVDGEPWRQGPCQVEVTHRNTALMLRHLSSAPLARMAAAVSEALDSCQAKGVITQIQRHVLTTELAAHLHSVT